jgi:hypothetical protein
MTELSDARLIKPPQFVDPNSDGLLVPTEAGKHVPFHPVQRMLSFRKAARA